MRSVITLFVLLLSFQLTASTGDRLIVEPGMANDFQCGATISGDIATFRFQNEVISYETAGTPFEHSWLVFFDVSRPNETDRRSSGFDVGVRYFPVQGTDRATSFHALLDEAEIFGFEYLQESFAPVYFEEGVLTAAVQGEDLALLLVKTQQTEFLFNPRLTQVYFWVLADGKAPRKCSALIVRE